MTGHIKRRYHDQALKKLIPLLQKFSSKQPFEVVVVDLKADHLSALAAECNVSYHFYYYIVAFSVYYL